MKVKLKGSFEDKGKVTRAFFIESERGMTLEILGGNGKVCKIECSCIHDIIATRVNVWGDLHIELDAKGINGLQLESYHVVIKRV